MRFSAYRGLDIGARGIAHEDLLLDRFQLGLQRFEHRKIAVDDLVHQRVEHVCRTVLSRCGSRSQRARTSAKPRSVSHAHRQDVIGTDENVDLADVQLVVLDFDRLQHGEQRVAVLLDLRPLMAVPGIFDGELVQVEFLLHFLELARRRILERDPDEAIGTLHIFADVFLRNVGELLAFLVRDAVD